MSNSPLRRSGMARLNETLPATHTFIHKWNERHLPLLLSRKESRTLAGFRPAECRRLSWLEWLVTNRIGLPARRQSPIPVLTGPGVE